MDLVSGDFSLWEAYPEKEQNIQGGAHLGHSPAHSAHADWSKSTESNSWILIGQSEILLTPGGRESAWVLQPSRAFRRAMR